MKIMNVAVSEPKEDVKPAIDNIVEYYNFKSNSKKYSALEIGERKIVLENSVQIDENSGDVFDELKKVEKTYDIITCSKMKLNDFDYYMLLSRCAKLIKNGGIFLFESSDCTNEFIKNKNNYTILQKTELLVCMEKN